MKNRKTTSSPPLSNYAPLRSNAQPVIGFLCPMVNYSITQELWAGINDVVAERGANHRKMRGRGLGVERALDRIERNITRCDSITLSQELAAGVEILLEPERFRRVIINLVDNAYQAMLEWGQSNDKPLVLSIQSTVVDQQLRISISDTGSGIPPDVLPHIFDPLYSTKGFGMGLGLPIVQEIVNQHSGKIEITSEIGKGTQAILWLPLLQPERDKG